MRVVGRVWARLFFGMVVLVLGLGLVGCHRGLEFTVAFKDAGGLQPGQYLVYHGVRIGKVTAVELDPAGGVKVQVKVAPNHIKTVYREARYEVKKSSGLVDVSGERALVMGDNGTTRTPVTRGEIIKGYQGMFADALETTKKWLQDAGTRLQEAASALADSPAVRDFQRDASRIMARAATEGQQTLEGFKREELPGLYKKALKLRDDLEKSGKLDDAKRFWSKFEAWYQEALK